jgi:hypothetical protein
VLRFFLTYAKAAAKVNLTSAFQFQQLDILKLGHNHLDQLPPHISYLHGIRTLHLQHNILTTLPPTLSNCRHLTQLDLTHNRLTTLPRGLGQLTKLKVLKLGDNELEQVCLNLNFLFLRLFKDWCVFHGVLLDISTFQSVLEPAAGVTITKSNNTDP